MNSIYKTISCHFFETFEVYLEISEDFSGYNSEIYDCIICYNPNKIEYNVFDGEITSIALSDGNSWR